MTILNNILAIIPARGGSKRIKKKNIVNICNKPIISWTLLELLKLIEKKKIVVSTDDKNIVKIVEGLGLEIPFIRPKSLADDFTTTSEVAKHALNWYEKNISSIDYVLIVYPTAIFVEVNDLVKAAKLMKKKPDCNVIFSATEYNHPIERALRVDDKNKVTMVFSEHYQTRTQDLQKSYHDAGQFYLCKSDVIRKSKPILNINAQFIIFPKTRAVDIDTLDDIELAEILFENKLKNNKV